MEAGSARQRPFSELTLLLRPKKEAGFIAYLFLITSMSELNPEFQVAALEQQLQPELHLTRWIGGGNCSETTAGAIAVWR